MAGFRARCSRPLDLLHGDGEAQRVEPDETVQNLGVRRMGPGQPWPRPRRGQAMGPSFVPQASVWPPGSGRSRVYRGGRPAGLGAAPTALPTRRHGGCWCAYSYLDNDLSRASTTGGSNGPDPTTRHNPLADRSRLALGCRSDRVALPAPRIAGQAKAAARLVWPQQPAPPWLEGVR